MSHWLIGIVLLEILALLILPLLSSVLSTSLAGLFCRSAAVILFALLSWFLQGLTAAEETPRFFQYSAGFLFSVLLLVSFFLLRPWSLPSLKRVILTPWLRSLPLVLLTVLGVYLWNREFYGAELDLSRNLEERLFRSLERNSGEEISFLNWILKSSLHLIGEHELDSNIQLTRFLFLLFSMSGVFALLHPLLNSFRDKLSVTFVILFSFGLGDIVLTAQYLLNAWGSLADGFGLPSLSRIPTFAAIADIFAKANPRDYLLHVFSIPLLAAISIEWSGLPVKNIPVTALLFWGIVAGLLLPIAPAEVILLLALLALVLFLVSPKDIAPRGVAGPFQAFLDYGPRLGILIVGGLITAGAFVTVEDLQNYKFRTQVQEPFSDWFSMFGVWGLGLITTMVLFETIRKDRFLSQGSEKKALLLFTALLLLGAALTLLVGNSPSAQLGFSPALFVAAALFSIVPALYCFQKDTPPTLRLACLFVVTPLAAMFLVLVTHVTLRPYALLGPWILCGVGTSALFMRVIRVPLREPVLKALRQITSTLLCLGLFVWGVLGIQR